MRSALAWKFSRSGRSTVILRYPNCVVGKIRLTATSSSVPSSVTGRVASSSKPARSCRMWAALSGGILAPFVTEAAAHRRPERGGVDQLYLAPALRRLAVGQQPHVGGDAGVVEELLRQRHQYFEHIVLQDVAADFALAAAGVAAEQR